MLEYKCNREGTHFVDVEPEYNQRVSNCGVETDKPVWAREPSCPACSFEAARDANAVWNILSRGLTELGVGHSEGTSVETAFPAGTAVVPAKRVTEAGTPASRSRRRRRVGSDGSLLHGRRGNVLADVLQLPDVNSAGVDDVTIPAGGYESYSSS